MKNTKKMRLSLKFPNNLLRIIYLFSLMNKKHIYIRDATEKDLAGILTVNCLSQRTEKANGLIQKRTKEEFQKLLRICKRFIIAESEGKIVGYVILLDERAPYPENEIFSFYPTRYHSFIFIDSVATHPDFRRQGVASAMYKAFLSKEKKRILVDFLVEPRNPESIGFHEHLGFRSLKDYIHLKNGMTAEVYEYKQR